ncbi:MAG: SDR family NAD(P)-dependent oxidoreductase [Sandaracinaceae bacterium]
MPFPPRPRAVITGAASGFGRAVALVLSDRGGRLVLSDIDEDGLAETREMAEGRGGTVHTARCDVRSAEDVEALAVLADDAFGGTDIVINNAGVAVAGTIGEVPLEDWRWAVDINLWGVVYGCHSFVPRMKKQGSGWVMNVASAAGLLSGATMGPYNVSKAGVVALSETLYGELAGTGVSVSALCPTFFQTKIHESARAPARLMRATEKLITKSKWSAEQIATIALDELEKGELYIIPQADGRVMWRAKRALGKRWFSVMSELAKPDGVLSKMRG